MTETKKRKAKQGTAQEHIRDAIELLRLALELLAKRGRPMSCAENTSVSVAKAKGMRHVEVATK